MMFLKNMCTGVVNNSIFDSNNMASDSTTNAFALVIVYRGSLFLVERTYFFNNTMDKGMLLITKQGTCVIESSHFLRNAGTCQKERHGILDVEDSSVTRIRRSTFSNNYCSRVYIDSPDIVISSSLFERNFEHIGGGLILLASVQSNTFTEQKTSAQLFENFLKENLSKEIKSQNWKQDDGKQPMTVYNCTFVNNSADSGGAIFATNVTLMLDKNTFVSNSAIHPYGFGGAVYLLGSFTKITNCVFIGNVGYFGVAVHAEKESLTIDSSVFNDNEGDGPGQGYGGAIGLKTLGTAGSHILFIANSTFNKNKAGLGGAIFCDAMSTIVQASTFMGNNAQEGGAIKMHSGNITDSFFLSNTANIEGGAVDTIPGSVISVIYTKFTLNQATVGGAIFTGKYATMACHYCSFDSNKAGFR